MINKKSLLQRIQSIRSPREKVDVYNPFLWEYLLENPGEALLLVQTAVDLAQQNNYDDGYYQALMNRGYCYLYTGHFDRSWTDFNDLLRYHRLQEDTLGEIRVLNALGLTAQKRGWFRTAGDCFRQSLIKSRQTGHSEREYVALANQADLFLNQGAPQEAHTLLENLMALLQEEELEGYKAVVLINLGRCFHYLGQPEKGLPYLREASALFESRREYTGQIVGLREEASLLLTLNQEAESRVLLEQTQEMSSSLGIPEEQCRTALCRARLSEISGQSEEAMGFYETAWKIAEDHSFLVMLAVAARSMADICAAAGDLKRAYALGKRAAEADKLRESQDFQGYLQMLASHSESLDEPVVLNTRGDQPLVTADKELRIPAIRQIGYRIAACLDLEKVLQMVHDHIVHILDAPVLGLAFYSEKRKKLDYRLFVERGVPVEPFSISVQEERSLGVWALNHEKTLYLRNAQEEGKQYVPDLLWHGSDEPMTHSIIYIPLMVETKKVGLLTVQSYQKNAYTEHHLDVLKLMASFIAIAMDNSLAHQRVRELNQDLEREKRELMKAYNQINFMANHDPLTGLVNRRFVEDLLTHALHQARRRQESVGLLFIDLDSFKPINDNYGHVAGDHVLQQVALRLQDSLRQSDAIGRIGGDEFVAVLHPVSDDAAARQVALTLLENLRRPMTLSTGEEVDLSASIGYALYPQDAGSADELLHRADEAMYRIKQKGKNSVGAYEADI